MTDLSLGDRMKLYYEDRARHFLPRRTPVIVRVDGRAFHTFTRGFNRPFDFDFVMAMLNATLRLAREMQGCKVAYVQSDEASFFLTDYDRLTSEAWFDYVQDKVVSISAAAMTAWFISELEDKLANHTKLPLFDARAFSLPREEVVNYFLWRAQDWKRNSITMWTGSMYSHKQMHGWNQGEQLRMCRETGKPWEDLPVQLRCGTFMRLGPVNENGFEMRCDVEPTYQEIARLVDPFIAGVT